MSGAPSGIGYGEAQVYSTNKSENAFNHLLQSQALERQREQKAIAEQLKTIDTKNLRDADRDEYFQKYQKWQDSSTKFRTEGNRNKKYQYQSESDTDYRDLKDHVNRSGEAKQRDTEFGNRLLDDRFRDQFKDDAISQFQGNFKKSINDPTYIADFNSLGRQVDEDKIMQKFTAGHKLLLSKATWAKPTQQKAQVGNNSGVYTQSRREVSAEAQEAFYINLYNGDRDVRKYIADRYGNLPTEQAIKQLVSDNRQSGELSETTKQEFTKNDTSAQDAARTNAYAIAREDRAAARKEAAGGNDEATQRQLMVAGLLKGDIAIEDRLQGIIKTNPLYGGKTIKIERPKYPKKGENKVTFVVPAKTVESSEVSNTGGVFNSKMSSKTKQDEYRVTFDLNQRNTGDNMNEFLNNVTGSKITNESYRGNKGNKNKGTADLASNPKTVTSADIKALVGKKNYEGYNEQELRDYYQNQLGYTIK